MTNIVLENSLDHNEKPLKAEDKVLPLNVSESKIVYPKTPTDAYEVANKKYVDDNTGTPSSVRYYYDIKLSSYYATATTVFVPLNGTMSERTSVSSSNEYIAFVAPYNGTIEKALFRSEASMDSTGAGTFEYTINESSDGTEAPLVASMRFVDETIDVADDTTIESDFTGSLYYGTNVLTKGKIYAIKVATPSASYDTNITFVFKWDVTT